MNSGNSDGAVRCVPQSKQNQQGTLPLPCRYSEQPSKRAGYSHCHPFEKTVRLGWGRHARTHAGNQVCRPGVSAPNPTNLRYTSEASQKSCWFALTFQRSDYWRSGHGDYRCLTPYTPLNLNSNSEFTLRPKVFFSLRETTKSAIGRLPMALVRAAKPSVTDQKPQPAFCSARVGVALNCRIKP